VRHLVAGDSRLSPCSTSGTGGARRRAVSLFVAVVAILAAGVPAAAQTAGFQFAAQAESKTEPNPQSVAVADVNADNKPDLVTANSGSNNISVLLAEGGGKFKAQEPYATGSAPAGVSVADLNGDKKLDLVAANSGSKTVSVLLGKGDGTFEGQKLSEVGEAPSAVAVADLNGDGKPDLVVANKASKTVSVLLGKGDGTFEEQKTFETELAPSAVAVADLNGDGKPDIVTANSESNSVSVLLGKGDGSLQEQSRFETGAGPAAVAIADLNGDNKLDLVVANSPASTASVLLGRGDGTFAAKTDFATGSGPAAIALTDLNADGKPDVVTANSEASSVSLLLNTSVAALETSPSSLIFPATLFGTKSAAQKVTVTNGGSAPLAVSAIAATGNFSASGCTPPVTLAAGASCSISVVFGPKGYGKLTGELTVASNAGAKKIGLSGNGLPPLPLVSTAPVGEINGPYVTLTGSIVSQGKGIFYFQYGKTLAYGSATPALELKSEFTPQLVAASVPLTPGTTYHYRLVATNLAGTVFGRDQTFTVPPEAPLLKVLRHGRLRGVLRHGLRLRVLEPSQANVTLTIFLDARTARAAHLVGSKHRSRVAIGKLRVSLKAATVKRVRLTFTHSAKRHLAGMSRLRLTIEGTPVAPNGVLGEPTDVRVQLKR
jgi:VCBS repeat protein